MYRSKVASVKISSPFKQAQPARVVLSSTVKTSISCFRLGGDFENVNMGQCLGIGTPAEEKVSFCTKEEQQPVPELSLNSFVVLKGR